MGSKSRDKLGGGGILKLKGKANAKTLRQSMLGVSEEKQARGESWGDDVPRQGGRCASQGGPWFW